MKEIRITETDTAKKAYWKESRLMPALQDGENTMVNIYADIHYQKLHGFGGAFTEAAAHIYQGMGKDKQKEIIGAFFDEEGLAFNMGRIHMNSCDFSLGNYSYIEEGDDSLKTFSIGHDKNEIIPMIKDAIGVSHENIEFMMSPWSPPAFMKTNGEMNNGGQLKSEYRKAWAEYYVKFIKAYAEEGIDIIYMNVQNEPAAVQDWDSCIYSAEEEAIFVRDFLYPALKEAGLSEKVKIFVWDHNKDAAYYRFRGSLMVSGAEELISGCSVHWYSGDHFETIKAIHDSFPSKEIFFSEGCIEYRVYGDAKGTLQAERYAHDIIGNLNNGCSAIYDWNLVLDMQGGPNHAGNFCAAPIMCDTEKDSYDKQLIYYYIGQFSRHIKRGAMCVASSKYTDKIETAAFVNPDGERVVVLLNKTDEAIPVILREEKHGAEMELPAHSIRTCRYYI